MNLISDLKIKIFSDGANLDDIIELAKDPVIKGFTTNPTLMRNAGVTNYKAFALEVLLHVPNRPISFEVFADDFDNMETQAREIASWGPNIYVKIPVTNTTGKFTGPVLSHLSNLGVKLNITAIMTAAQVSAVAETLNSDVPSIVSVFAGRVADTGVDPVPLMRECVRILESLPAAELLWASPRELFNVIHADDVGCHIITATTDILKKLKLMGKNLDEYSLETVKMFYQDAVAADYSIGIPSKAAAE